MSVSSQAPKVPNGTKDEDEDSEVTLSQSCTSPVGEVEAPKVEPCAVNQRLEALSRKELITLIETQAADLVDFTGLISRFKIENVRLSRSLKKARHQINLILHAVQEFFADSMRREWFRRCRDDSSLCEFFQRLVNWYRAVVQEDPTVAFYQRIWQYERGEDGNVKDSRDVTKEPESWVEDVANVCSEGAAKVGGSAHFSVGSARGNTSKRPCSSHLYDACLARARLQKENARLREVNAKLHRTATTLERELGMLRSRGSTLPEIHAFVKLQPPQPEDSRPLRSRSLDRFSDSEVEQTRMRASSVPSRSEEGWRDRVFGLSLGANERPPSGR